MSLVTQHSAFNKHEMTKSIENSSSQFDLITKFIYRQRVSPVYLKSLHKFEKFLRVIKAFLENFIQI